MVEYDNIGGDNGRIVDEKLAERIKRLADRSDYILGVPRSEVGENWTSNPQRKTEYFINMSWSGIDHMDIDEYPMRTILSITLEQRKGEEVHNILVRPVVIDDSGLEERISEIMDAEDFHKGPNHVETVYDSIALHYHYKSGYDREGVMDIMRRSVKAFEEAVKFAIEEGE